MPLAKRAGVLTSKPRPEQQPSPPAAAPAQAPRRAAEKATTTGNPPAIDLTDDAGAARAPDNSGNQPEPKGKATRKATASKPRTTRQSPVEAENSTGGQPRKGEQPQMSVRLTQELWDWVDTQAGQRRLARRHILFEAVELNRQALKDHFTTTIDQGAGLFHYRGEPQDVDGDHVARTLRMDQSEKDVLKQLIEESGAPSMSFYLRIAADLEMKKKQKPA